MRSLQQAVVTAVWSLGGIVSCVLRSKSRFSTCSCIGNPQKQIGISHGVVLALPNQSQSLALIENSALSLLVKIQT